MDFIIGLLRSTREHDSIMVLVGKMIRKRILFL